MIFNKAWLLSLLLPSSSWAFSKNRVLEDDLNDDHPFLFMSPSPSEMNVTVYTDDDEVVVPIYLKTAQIGGSNAFFLPYHETQDGYTIDMFDGEYVYITVDATGDFISSGLAVGIHDPATDTIKIGPKTGQTLTVHEYKDAVAIKSQRRLRGPIVAKDNYSLTANRRLQTTNKQLVVPFRFSNHGSRTLPSENDLSILFNHVGPHSLVPSGSVRDVMLQNSYNTIAVDSVIAPRVTLDWQYTESYCSGGNYGAHENMEECLRNALDKVDSANNGIVLADFDQDGDDFIDILAFSHSGYAAEHNAIIDANGVYANYRIWSHKYVIWPYWIGDDTVTKAFDYHISSSLWGVTGSNIGRIGVIAHELGHMFRLPDLYDTDNSGNGIGSYDLMANSWGFDFSQLYPPLMSSWSKLFTEWIQPLEVSSSGTYPLRQTCEHADVIKISRGFANNEYLLLENRQPCGFDAQMPQGGVAIYHIDDQADYNKEGYPGSVVDSAVEWLHDHYRVALLQADGLYELETKENRGNGGDVFFDDTISPNGVLKAVKADPNTNSYRDNVFTDTDITIVIGSSGDTMQVEISFGDEPPPTTMPTIQKAQQMSWEITRYGDKTLFHRTFEELVVATPFNISNRDFGGEVFQRDCRTPFSDPDAIKVSNEFTVDGLGDGFKEVEIEVSANHTAVVAMDNSPWVDLGLGGYFDFCLVTSLYFMGDVVHFLETQQNVTMDYSGYFNVTDINADRTDATDEDLETNFNEYISAYLCDSDLTELDEDAIFTQGDFFKVCVTSKNTDLVLINDIESVTVSQPEGGGDSFTYIENGTPVSNEIAVDPVCEDNVCHTGLQLLARFFVEENPKDLTVGGELDIQLLQGTERRRLKVPVQKAITSSSIEDKRVSRYAQEKKDSGAFGLVIKLNQSFDESGVQTSVLLASAWTVSCATVLFW